MDKEDEALWNRYADNLIRRETESNREARFESGPEFSAAYEDLLQFFLGMAGPNGEDPILSIHVSGRRLEASFKRENEILHIIPLEKGIITAGMLRTLKDEILAILLAPDVSDSDFF